MHQIEGGETTSGVREKDSEGSSPWSTSAIEVLAAVGVAEHPMQPIW
jgi:hypothetical protein